MSGSLEITNGDVPVGYIRPDFPALSFTLSENPYTSALLFYAWDIYVFTVFWFLIFSIGLHVIVVAVVYITGYKRREMTWSHTAFVFVSYVALGAFYGFVLGSFIGLLLGSIYRAGALHMSTWVPFTWAFGVTLFTIFSSHESSLIDM